MSLHLIHGPLNSGRTALVRGRLAADLDRGPVLVTPTAAARFAIEAELCGDRGAVLGITSLTGIESLARQLLADGTGERPVQVADAQRLRLVAQAVAASRLRLLRRSAASPGFPVGMGKLIADLRSSGVSPGRDPAGDGYLAELLEIYGNYLVAVERAGLTDPADLPGLAAATVRANPDLWAERPVYLHGFDDMSPGQLELVVALAATAQVTVTAIRDDRRALSARSSLYEILRERLEPTEQATEARRYGDRPQLLFHLERWFAEDDAPRVQADGSLRYLRAAGERGEAELIAEQVKHLLTAGSPAAEIAIAVRDPARRGPQLADCLRAAGIPVALIAERPLAATATGQAALALLAAARPEAGSAEILRHLRATAATDPDPGARPDRLEQQVLRGRETSAAGAGRLWARLGGDLKDLERLREDPAYLAEYGERFAQATLATLVSAPGPLAPDPDVIALEQAGADCLGEIVAGLARLPDSLTLPVLAAAVRAATFPSWRGPVGARVRIASPYALFTSSGVRHLFVASLQDREFPRRGSDGPFLSEEQRELIGMRRRSDPELEELYLFQVCLTLPTEGLWLSSRAADDEGKAEQPSSFLSLLEQLIEPGGELPVYERDLDLVTYRAESAPSYHEWLREMARRGDTDLEPVGRARHRAERAAATRPLSHPRVLAELAGREEFGASEIEAFASNPAAWFSDRELRPLPLGPDPEPLTDGSIAHRILERLYREKPGGFPQPTPETVAAWLARLPALTAESGAELGRVGDFRDRVALRRIERYLARFISDQAVAHAEGFEPRLFEAAFGSREDCEQPPLHLEGWALSGVIDRVDLTPARDLALLHDYKLSSSATPQARFLLECKLQIPLYLTALRELWGFPVAGGLYQPLRATELKPRGLILAEEETVTPLGGLALTATDRLPAEQFEGLLDEAVAAATAVVADLRAGRIDRDPGDEARVPPPAAAAIHRSFADSFEDPLDRPPDPEEAE